MFKLFRKKSKRDKLFEKHQKLQEEAYKLSTTSRVQSDQKYAEAEEVLRLIDELDQNQSS